MDSNKSKINNQYDRVMPRVFNKSEQKIEKTKMVTRHDIGLSHTKSNKKSVSNVTSSVRSELPTVLDNYEPDKCVDKVTMRSFIVKPRRTLKSLEPPLLAKELFAEKTHIRNLVKTPRSAPALSKMVGKTKDSLKRDIVSETRLKDLKDEINSFDESEKLSHMRSKLFKSCGVLLDEEGRVFIDKGVQVVEQSDMVKLPIKAYPDPADYKTFTPTGIIKLVGLILDDEER